MFEDFFPAFIQHQRNSMEFLKKSQNRWIGNIYLHCSRKYSPWPLKCPTPVITYVWHQKCISMELLLNSTPQYSTEYDWNNNYNHFQLRERNLKKFKKAECAHITYYYFRVNFLLSASTLLDSMLKSALFYRQSKASLYKTAVHPSEDLMQSYLPWTASEGTHGMRNSIVEQVRGSGILKINVHPILAPPAFKYGLFCTGT